MKPFAQDWKAGKFRLDPCGKGLAPGMHGPTQMKVFRHGKRRKDPSALGTKGNALANDIFGGNAVDPHAFEFDPAPRLRKANGIEGRTFPGAV